jgi:hypothetical protein
VYISQLLLRIRSGLGVAYKDDLARPIPAPEKEPQCDGVLVHANMDGATNWMAPSFDPRTRLFYGNAQTASRFFE